MSIQDEVSRLGTAKSAIADAITAKGVTVPAETKLDGYAALVGQIQTGGGGGAPNEIIKNLFLSEGVSFQVERVTYSEFSTSYYPYYLGIAIRPVSEHEEDNMQILFFYNSYDYMPPRTVNLEGVDLYINIPDGIAVEYTGDYDLAEVIFLTDVKISPT